MPLQKFEVQGEDYLQKVAKRQSDTASIIYLPASWTGRKIACILLEQEHEQGVPKHPRTDE